MSEKFFYDVVYAAADNKTDFNSVLSIAHTKDNKSEKITLFLEKDVSYKSRFLDEDKEKNIPFRLYIDLLNTRIKKNINKTTPGQSNVINIRFAQRTQTTSRFVLDLKNKIYLDDYNITRLDNPSRIVIELFKIKKQASSPQNISKTTLSVSDSENIIEQKSLGTKIDNDLKEPVQQIKPEQRHKQTSDSFVIVIDPGHGGKDPGAIGYNGIMEKDVCLSISLELKNMMLEKFKCEIIFTRDSDMFVSLDERAEIANRNNADLLISIHANSHEDATLTGIETYYLNFSSDATARSVAARENFTTPSEISDLELILFDLLQNNKINQSSILAGYLHNSIVNNVSNKYRDLRNLGVKHAPMRILIEADMPCVLIETAFISSPSDSQRLTNKSYQQLLAKGILEGINNYTAKQQTAFYKKVY